MTRGKLDSDTLVKLVLILVVIWLALEVLDTFLGVLGSLLSGLPTVVGVALLVIIVLWLLDYI